MKTVKLLFFSCLFIFLSCKKESQKNIEEENTYQVVSLLVENFKQYIVLPPLLTKPPGSKYSKRTVKDSLWVYKNHYNQLVKKKAIALTNKMFDIKKVYNFRSKCDVNKKLIEKFNTLKENKKLDLAKVTVLGKDSLIEYKKEFTKQPRKGFDKIDLALNFSRIAFNKEYNKAILIVGASKGRLNGFSTLIYLEKENYVWQIKCQKGLSIS